MAKTKSQDQPRERTNLSQSTTIRVLTEAGYRCAVPTCRGILALDLHHMWEVSAGGGDETGNLIALCPTCHGLYHRGTISQEAIYCYKAMLVAIGRAFDVEAIDKLMFLDKVTSAPIVMSGDGVLQFARLIGAGLADYKMVANNNWQIVTYTVCISAQGQFLLDAWKRGDRTQLAQALSVGLRGLEITGLA